MISNLTIKDGLVHCAADAPACFGGGGIENARSLTLDNLMVSDNTAVGDIQSLGGGIDNANGTLSLG